VRGERRREPPLHLAEATLEAAERVAAELLGVEVEIGGRESSGEEDVAELVLDARAVVAGEGFASSRSSSAIFATASLASTT
jgi:hypothetical protein